MGYSSHLGRTATHRKSLLRNLVTDLLTYESITTTHAKAKEAQKAAESLIQLAKDRSPSVQQAKVRANESIFKPGVTIPKLFDEIAPRFKDRTGGFTRILKLEPRLGDNAPQSILELVGGERDMRFAMTARVVARLEKQGLPLDKTTKMNVTKILKSHSQEAWRQEVEFMKEQFYKTEESIANEPPQREPTKRAPIKMVENPLTQQK